MTTEERMAWIDQASYEEMLRLVRFEPIGSPWFPGNELGEYFYKVLGKKSDQLTEQELIETSKRVGF